MAKKKKLPKWATTITPFSKFLALSMLIIFPILGFYLGIYYERTVLQSVEKKVSQLSPNKIILMLSENQNTPPVIVKTITDNQKIQQWYAEMQTLPTPQQGTYNCPSDSNKRYFVDFYYKEALLLHAVVDPVGCRFIQIGVMENKTGFDFQKMVDSQ